MEMEPVPRERRTRAEAVLRRPTARIAEDLALI
jgi:hypothetical protein